MRYNKQAFLAVPLAGCASQTVPHEPAVTLRHTVLMSTNAAGSQVVTTRGR